MADNDQRPHKGEQRFARSIEQALPDYDFVERHHIDVDATQQYCYDAARHLDFSRSRTIRWLFTIRRLHNNELSIQAMTGGDTFAVLVEKPPTEFVIGLASEGLTAISITSKRQFAELQPASGLKIAWNFETQPIPDGRTRLHTETRVACSGRAAKTAFSIYWMLVRPFSGLIRKEMLKVAKTAAEQRP